MAANEQFRRARERLRSPRHANEPMSRAELAQLVNQHVWEKHQQLTGLDSNYIGKLERGVVRWPNALYREALRSVLGVADDAHLGFRPPRGIGERMAGAPDRRTIGFGSPVVDPGALLELTTPTATPARIGPTEIEQVRRSAQVFAEWDNRFGGLAREAPMAQLRWSAQLLHDTTCSAELRGELLSAVAYLAHTCGFMAFDGYAFADARRVFRFGLACAEEANDWHLRARLLASMARLEIWVGQPDEGLTYTQLALVRADRLTATERAMLNSLAARALARMQQGSETRAAIGRADESLAQQDVAVDPPWMGYYDQAQHDGDLGVALLDLALVELAAPHDARDRLVNAIERRRPTLVRSRALSQVNLAKLVMATGDPAEGVAVGHAALDTAGPVRSRRVADDLADLSRHAARHENRADVDELRQRIGVVIAA